MSTAYGGWFFPSGDGHSPSGAEMSSKSPAVSDPNCTTWSYSLIFALSKYIQSGRERTNHYQLLTMATHKPWKISKSIIFFTENVMRTNMQSWRPELTL